MSDDHLKWSLVSVKGIAIRENKAVLVKNARQEWDLPGGKLEIGESLSQCLAREFAEELGIQVTWGPVIDVVHHHMHQNIIVVIVACESVSADALHISDEHTAAQWFDLAALDSLNIVPHYRAALLRCLQ